MNFNSIFDKFVRATSWLWLPFYALYHLIEEIFKD